MLPTERDSDNRNTQQHPENQMGESDPYPSENQPQKVHDGRQAPRALFGHNRTLSEREQRQHAQFKSLNPERNPHDRKAQHNPAEDVLYGHE